MKRWLIFLAACGSGSKASIDAPINASIDAKPQPSADVHLIGRFSQDARFEWPGSTIATRIDGTSITVKLDDTGQNRFEVWIDGALAPPIVGQQGPHEYTIASGLAAGPHDVVIERRTETFFGVTQYLGFPGATFVATPGPSRWIEFVGDSITCGYGVLGPDESSCFSNDTEAESRGWASLAARALGAAHSTIAYSGKGVIRNNGGEPGELMPALYERTIVEEDATWDFAQYTPDVVVVDLGTNDFSIGDPGAPFVTAYEAFLAGIRARYPSAWLVVAQSPMLSDGYPQGAMQRTKAAAYFQQIVADRANAGDARVVYADIAEQQASDGYGCDYHPSATTHMKMAAALETTIKSVTGW
ncbi:MAG TPA: SGNH/GDSL hydrolase family protein [Kofleriaceae bacterium]|nr:SGNH/GDSL hydrolase family protein [Kofleriaceae bacterium]